MAEVLIIQVPNNCVQYKEDIRRFVDAMLHKLGKNAEKKGRWETVSMEDALLGIERELQELEEAVKLGNTVDTLLEAADVANWAMIGASIIIERGK